MKKWFVLETAIHHNIESKRVYLFFLLICFWYDSQWVIISKSPPTLPFLFSVFIPFERVYKRAVACFSHTVNTTHTEQQQQHARQHSTRCSTCICCCFSLPLLPFLKINFPMKFLDDFQFFFSAHGNDITFLSQKRAKKNSYRVAQKTYQKGKASRIYI